MTSVVIPRRVKLKEAQTKTQDIYEDRQASPAAIAYDMLCKELFD